MRRSADCVTALLSVDVLLASAGSSVLLLTVAVLEIDPPTNDGDIAITSVSSGSLCPAGSAPSCVQVTCCPDSEQFHPAPPCEMKRSPLGRLSMTVIGGAASLGPRLVTARLYFEVCPETNAPLSVLTMRRSAWVAETLLVDDVLFALFGSGVALLTEAVLTIVCATRSAASETVSVIGFADPPAGSAAARVHVTTPLRKLHDHPAPVAETKPSLPGSVSTTERGAAASLGPALATRSE